jgi:hypothetical protein
MSTFREPVFNLDTLTNSDTVITWLGRTNELINAVNSFYLIDTFDGQGICSTRADGVVTLNIDAGPGLGFNASNELVIDFSSTTELTSASNNSPILGTDLLLLQRGGVSYKVKANSVLPATILHEHTFSSNVFFNTFARINYLEIGSSSGFSVLNYTNNNIDTPKGLNIFSGINLSPENMFRNVLPEIVADSDYSASNLFDYATFSFATARYSADYLTEQGLDSGLSSGQYFSQNRVVFSVYTGNPSTGFVSNPSGGNFGDSQGITWPIRWNTTYDKNGCYVSFDEGFADNDGQVRYNNSAFSYSFLQNPVDFSTQGLFSINGAISFDTTLSPVCTSIPNGLNKIPVTSTNGVLNKKFTNRIVTSEYSSLVIGDLVCASTITDGVILYEKAQASTGGNGDVVGIVEDIDAGIATIVLNGEFELVSYVGLEAGTKYYLSQTTAGEFVPEGTYTTGIIKPVFIAITEDSGILLSASANEVTSITSITTFNQSDSSTETLEIDSSNYDLNLIGGQNIRLDVNSNNEIEIRVEGLAGAQDTFKYISVNGVGSTDGDVTLGANIPNDTLYFTSSTLGISANDTTNTINIEAPNAFRTFKFSGSSEQSYVPESQTDTLQFIAGSGISFAQNTDDSVIISASITGAVDVTSLDHGAGLRMFASDYDNTSTIVSLMGGDSDFFNSGHSSYAATNVFLNPNLTITRDVSNPSITDKFVYNSTNYFLNDSGNWPASVHDTFLPDELAGYVIGRITPSHVGDNVTNPDSRIRRLTRRDLRFFLGIAGTGFIDNINSVFNQWTLYNGPEGGTTVTAATKNGSLIFESGAGIEITDGGAVLGPNRIKITNTGIAQNAFSSVVIKNNLGTTIDSFDANTSADSFVLKSGRFVSIDTDTNNDTAIFDIAIDDDYVLLGNPGTTDGMNVIDLSSSSYCLVGRAGGGIESITDLDLRWTGTTSGTLAKPSMELPYFGAVQVGTSPTPTILNAYGTNKGVLKLEAGNSNITLTADDTTNTISISATGSGTGPTSTGVGNIFVNSNQFNFGNGVLSKLKFADGGGISFNSTIEGTDQVTITPSLTAIPGNSILGNVNSGSGTPTSIGINNSSVLARTPSGVLGSMTITAAAGTTSVKSILDARYYTSVSVKNGTTTTNATTLATSTAVTGASIQFVAGINTSLSTTGSTSTQSVININSATNLFTDMNPSVSSKSLGSIVYNEFTHGVSEKITASDRGILQYYTLYDSDLDSNLTLLSKEVIYPVSKTSVSVTTTGLSIPNINVPNGSIQEILYHSGYTLTVLNRIAGATTRGTYTVDASDMAFTSSGNINFIGTGTNIGFGSRLLKATASVNALKFVTDTGSVLNFAAFATGASTAATTPNASMIFHASGSVRFAMAGALNSSTNWLQIDGASANQTITSSGAITINANTTFTSGRTVTFTGVTTVGLTASAHAGGTNGLGDSGTVINTHQSVETEATNGTISRADKLLAWQIGAVTRAKPTLLNKIGIVNGDGLYDLDLTAISTATLYSGATAFNSTNYGAFNTANKGPLYMVVPNGTNPATAGVSGPPGQIIFVKAT